MKRRRTRYWWLLYNWALAENKVTHHSDRGTSKSSSRCRNATPQSPRTRNSSSRRSSGFSDFTDLQYFA
uniref:Secreted protein n=1 Tax=Mesocestoides corti TaxID=53468 RepID=A0A5K3F8B8_MESCO